MVDACAAAAAATPAADLKSDPVPENNTYPGTPTRAAAASSVAQDGGAQAHAAAAAPSPDDPNPTEAAAAAPSPDDPNPTEAELAEARQRRQWREEHLGQGPGDKTLGAAGGAPEVDADGYDEESRWYEFAVDDLAAADGSELVLTDDDGESDEEDEEDVAAADAAQGAGRAGGSRPGMYRWAESELSLAAGRGRRGRSGHRTGPRRRGGAGGGRRSTCGGRRCCSHRVWLWIGRSGANGWAAGCGGGARRCRRGPPTAQQPPSWCQNWHPAAQQSAPQRQAVLAQGQQRPLAPHRILVRQAPPALCRCRSAGAWARGCSRWGCALAVQAQLGLVSGRLRERAPPRPRLRTARGPLRRRGWGQGLAALRHTSRPPSRRQPAARPRARTRRRRARAQPVRRARQRANRCRRPRQAVKVTHLVLPPALMWPRSRQRRWLVAALSLREWTMVLLGTRLPGRRRRATGSRRGR